MPRLRSRLSLLPILVLCGVAGCAGTSQTSPAAHPKTAAEAQSDAAALPPADAERYQVPVEGAPARGAAHPLVTIVVFSDFQCPYCAQSRTTLARLLAAYPDELRVVFRNHPMPFHEHALAAAEAAAEARAEGGDAGFWKMHDLLFAHQDALGTNDLEQYAKEAGLDVDKFRTAMRDHRHIRAILQDQALAIGLDVRGTPGHFIDGRPLMGAQPYAEFDRMVRQEVALAKKKMAEGTPRGALYAAIEKGATPPQPVTVPESVVEELTDARRYVPVDGSPVRGNPKALVTIVEFGDFECPFCAQAQPTLDALRQKYGDELRIVFKNFSLPFHEHSMLAHEAAMEARAQKGDAGFWAMYDRLYSDVEKLSPGDLEADAKALGLNMRRFRKALDEHTHQQEIADDMAVGQRMGVEGTPTFFVNGRRVTGAQPEEVFATKVDQGLEEARALLAQGVARPDIYRRVTGGDGAQN